KPYRRSPSRGNDRARALRVAASRARVGRSARMALAESPRAPAPERAVAAPRARAWSPRLGVAAGIAAVALFYVAAYGDATGTFFSFDDYWVLARTATMPGHGPGDVARWFGFDHTGFVLYRPFSTV